MISFCEITEQDFHMESDAFIWTEFQANDNAILTSFFGKQDIWKTKQTIFHVVGLWNH
jgi:hypothetical protein